MTAHVLIVDDEASVLSMLFTVFNERGYRNVSTATDYGEAMSAMDNSCFDLILCDIMLGSKTGIDVLKAVRERGIDTPLILMTGKPDIETAIMAVKLGAFDYVKKPIKLKPLFETVEDALRQNRAKEEERLSTLEDRSKLNLEIKTYQMHLERLQEQIDSATDVYGDLVKLKERRFSAEISWRHRPWPTWAGISWMCGN